MDALKELLTTPFGLLSAGTIAFMLAMGTFIFVWVRRKIAEDERHSPAAH